MVNGSKTRGVAVMGYVIYHGYAPDFTPEQLARHAGVRLYPDGHPGQEHDAPCPDGGQHRLIPAAGPPAAFRPARCAGGRNHWPVLEEAA